MTRKLVREVCCLNVFLFASSVAQDAHHSGDGRLSGEAARRRECEVHTVAHAGPSGNPCNDADLIYCVRRAEDSVRIGAVLVLM